MKKIISTLLLLVLVFSLAACDTTSNVAKVESAQVSAIVYKTAADARWGYRYVYVVYDGAENRWYDEGGEIYNYYNTRLGATIDCYLITKTYENGKVERELVYNEDLWKAQLQGGE